MTCRVCETCTNNGKQHVIYLGTPGRRALIATVLGASGSRIVVDGYCSQSYGGLPVEIVSGTWCAVLSAPTVKGRASVDLMNECRQQGYMGAWIVIGDEGYDEALHEGAHDHLAVSEITSLRLEKAIRFAARQAGEARRLALAADYDHLTGALNRRGFGDRCDRALRMYDRTGEDFAVVCIDMNGFKPVNDRHGHLVGDAVLRIVKERICQCVRDTDCVARVGGDEFAILCHRVNDFTAILRLVQKIRQTITQPMAIDGVSLAVGMSAGAAMYPRDGDTVGKVLSCADARMYKDKNRGLVLMRNDRENSEHTFTGSSSGQCSGG